MKRKKLFDAFGEERDYIDDGKSEVELGKVIKRMVDIYLNSDQTVFMINFSKFERMVKLNSKIRETYPDKEDVSKVYAAISFFDQMSKKQSYNQAYEVASNHYKIPEKFLRSIIGTRNANRRNGLNW